MLKALASFWHSLANKAPWNWKVNWNTVEGGDSLLLCLPLFHSWWGRITVGTKRHKGGTLVYVFGFVHLSVRVWVFFLFFFACQLCPEVKAAIFLRDSISSAQTQMRNLPYFQSVCDVKEGGEKKHQSSPHNSENLKVPLLSCWSMKIPSYKNQRAADHSWNPEIRPCPGILVLYRWKAICAQNLLFPAFLSRVCRNTRDTDALCLLHTWWM